jgi:hypothetical protein
MLLGPGRMRRPESTAIETLRDAEELEESSRITSSTRRDSVACKCRANGISVRTLTRGGSSASYPQGATRGPDLCRKSGSNAFARLAMRQRQKRDRVPSVPAKL